MRSHGPRTTLPRHQVLAAAGLLTLAAPLQAAQVTIDFDAASSAATGAVSIGLPTYTEDGVNVTTLSPSVPSVYAYAAGWQSGRGSYNGTTTAVVVAQGETGESSTVSFVLDTVTGRPFSLLSIEVAELFNDGDFAESLGAESLTVIGSHGGGGTIAMTFALDGLSDGVGGVDDFERIDFGTGWENLSSVAFTAVNTDAPVDSIHAVYLNFDNVVLDLAPVPAPLPLVLLGSGLTVLALTRRGNG